MNFKFTEEIEVTKLLESVADVSYISGQKNFTSGDPRQDMELFIKWAKEFECLHEETDWDDIDYYLAIKAFTEDKLKINLS